MDIASLNYKELFTIDLNSLSISELDALIDRLQFIGQNIKARKLKVTGKPTPAATLRFDIDSISTFSRLIDFIGNEYAKFKFTQLKLYEGIEPSAFSNFLQVLLTRRTALEDRITMLLRNIYDMGRIIERLFYEARILKERIELFDKVKKGGTEGEVAERTLKQLWLDNIDSRKGEASLTAMARNRGMPVVSVFMAVNSEKDFDKVLPKPIGNDQSAKDKIEYNNRIKSIVLPRLQEYLNWKKYAEPELRTRFNMTMHELKAEYASYKLYVSELAEYINIRNRLRLKTVGSESDFMTNVSDTFFDKIRLSLSFIGYSEQFYRMYKVTQMKLFNKQKVISSVIPKPTPNLVKSIYEAGPVFDAKKLKMFGPKFITAIRVDIDVNLSAAPEGSLKVAPNMQIFPEIYKGSASLTFYPFGFLTREWNLLNKAFALKLQKSVFEIMDITKSIETIQKDIEGLIAEFDKKEAKKVEPQKGSFFLLDIYNSFKEDFLGITESIKELSLALELSSAKINLDKLNESLLKRYGEDNVAKVASYLANDSFSKFYEDVKKTFIVV